jgi:hypothetical protein
MASIMASATPCCFCAMQSALTMQEQDTQRLRLLFYVATSGRRGDRSLLYTGHASLMSMVAVGLVDVSAALSNSNTELLSQHYLPYCRQNLSRHVINGAVVTQLFIDGGEFFRFPRMSW